MQDIVKQFIDNPLFQLSGWVLAVIAIPLSIILYFKSKTNKSIKYTTASFNVIRNHVGKIDGISIMYTDNSTDVRIDNLTVTKLAFWNSGNAPITKNDVAKADKIRISLGDSYGIVICEIISSTNESNKVVLTKAPKSKFAEISFDFLNPKDGAIFYVAHTGHRGSDVVLAGTVIGGVPIKRVGVISPTRYFQLKRFAKHPLTIISLFMLLMSPWLVIMFDCYRLMRFKNDPANFEASLRGDIWRSIVITMAYFIIVIYIIWSFFKQRLPKRMSGFYDDL